jgi:hypothetical protein
VDPFKKLAFLLYYFVNHKVGVLKLAHGMTVSKMAFQYADTISFKVGVSVYQIDYSKVGIFYLPCLKSWPFSVGVFLSNTHFIFISSLNHFFKWLFSFPAG